MFPDYNLPHAGDGGVARGEPRVRGGRVSSGIWGWARRGGSSNASVAVLASEPRDGTPPGGRRFFISGPWGGRSLARSDVEGARGRVARKRAFADGRARWAFHRRRRAVRAGGASHFEDTAGILMIRKMLPEAADVVFHDAVAGEKPCRQAVEVVEPMSIPLELVDEPPDVRRQCTYPQNGRTAPSTKSRPRRRARATSNKYQRRRADNGHAA